MKTLRRAVLMALAAQVMACGQYSGPQPGATYFWRINSSALEYGACSDAADFRGDFQAAPFGENTFLIYKVSKDGKQAVQQFCTRLDSSSCKPKENGIVFNIAGRELTFTETVTDVIPDTGCSLRQTLTWTATDATKSLSLDIANVLTLIESGPACAKVETDLKNRSPNRLGVEGCVITSKLGAELR